MVFPDQFPKAVDSVSYTTESIELSYLTAWLLTVAGVVIRCSPMQAAKLLEAIGPCLHSHAGNSDCLAPIPEKKEQWFKFLQKISSGTLHLANVHQRQLR